MAVESERLKKNKTEKSTNDMEELCIREQKLIVL